MLSNKAGIDARYAKSSEYKETLDAIIKTDKCPFCPDNFKYHKKAILKKFNGWCITENSWPYENTQYHFLLICGEHKEEFIELNDKDFKAIKVLTNWVIKKYNILGGGLAFRFGDSTYTGATVRHLHAHVLVPQLDNQKGMAIPVRFPIG